MVQVYDWACVANPWLNYCCWSWQMLHVMRDYVVEHAELLGNWKLGQWQMAVLIFTVVQLYKFCRWLVSDLWVICGWLVCGLCMVVLCVVCEGKVSELTAFTTWHSFEACPSDSSWEMIPYLIILLIVHTLFIKTGSCSSKMHIPNFLPRNSNHLYEKYSHFRCQQKSNIATLFSH